MANIGEPIRRHTVVPLSEPITAPEGPTRQTPSVTPPAPSQHPGESPSRSPSQPSRSLVGVLLPTGALLAERWYLGR